MPTSPAPNAGPAMCPGVAVLAGGGGAGGGDGSGNGGGDGNGGGGDGSGNGAGGDGKQAPDPNKHPECGTASHPVDVVTGRAFTHPLVDLSLPGPLPLVFQRIYSSKMHQRDAGLGFGWAHSLGWEIEVGRRSLDVWNDQGLMTRFDEVPKPGEEILGPWGFLVRRNHQGFWLDIDDGLFRQFEPVDGEEKRFRLSSVEDRNRNRISLRYEAGRLAEIQDSAGRIVRVRTTREGRIASIEARNAVAQGQWIAFATYTYDEEGNLTSVTDADGHVARYAYDDEHKLTADTDRIGLCFHFVYDKQRRCVESWGDYPGRRDPSLIDDIPKRLADGETRTKGVHHCRFDYMPGHYSEVADSTMVRKYAGNARGTLDKRVEGPALVKATYREDGHILSRREADGGITRYERDARGRLTKLIDPLERVTSMVRDDNGLVAEFTDPAGGVTRAERDARGNILLFTDTAGAATAFQYDERGLITEAVSPTGARTAYVYDAQGNLLAVTLPNGGVYRLVYDALGRRLSLTDPLGAETRYAYSPRGDLVAVRDAQGGVTRYSYDGEGHLVQVVDPGDHVTLLAWGGYHRLCERKDANGHVVRLRYNLEGELCEVLNERGEVHRLNNSYSGRLTGETTFDGRELRYSHDKVGRVTRVTNGAGEHTDLSYDLAGQLLKRELHDGAVEEYSYDILGNLTGVKAPSGELRFERDPLGRVVREAQIVGSKEHWTQVVYDAAGDRVGRKTSLGHVEKVARGALGERTRTVLDTAHVVEHQIDVLGRETARGLPGGGWLQTAYDSLGRVSRRRAGTTAAEGWGPERLSVDMAYRYEPSGELVESWDRARGRTQYAYDPIGQLLAMVPEKARGELFRYDERGNLHEVGEGAEDREYGQGNRLLHKGDWAYTWDADGRLKEKRRGGEQPEVWRYTWDATGLLKQVDGPDRLRVTFTYDPFARRLEKRVLRDRAMVSQTRFVWDGDVLVHEIEARAREGGDPVIEERTYCFEDDGFAPVAHREKRLDDVGRESGGWFHYVNDPIGTPEKLVDGTGAVACELRRKAWGETEEAEGARARTRIRFQGQYEDEETGLRYNRWRYYDAEAGRFLCVDPMGLRGATNGYRYATNPVAWVDQLGLIDRVAPDLSRSNYSPAEQAAIQDTIARVDGRQPPPAPGTPQATKWGEEFKNYPRGSRQCPDLPKRPPGYYKEYTVVLPGQTDRGAKRVVAGNSGEIFYTNSHYTPDVKGSKPYERLR